MQPAEGKSRFISVRGRKLHYLEYGGAGLAMLCVHGGAANAHWFDFVAAGFTSSYRVFALDLPGHGDSDWSDADSYTGQSYALDVAAAVEQLDLRDFVLMGHSMGGMVSLLYAATKPERLGKLIVLDSTLRVTSAKTGQLRNIGLRPGRSYANQDELAVNFKLAAEGTFAPPSTIEYIGRQSGRQQSDGTWRLKVDRATLTKRDPIDGLALLPELRVPTLIVRAAFSTRVPPETEATAKRSPAPIRFDSVAESYHHITLDNPEGLIRVVRAFLKVP